MQICEIYFVLLVIYVDIFYGGFDFWVMKERKDVDNKGQGFILLFFQEEVKLLFRLLFFVYLWKWFYLFDDFFEVL